MRKIAIIGAGNMGGAIAKGLSQSHLAYTLDIWISNPSPEKLSALRRAYPNLHTTGDNAEAAKWADVVLLAVKPWLVQKVLEEIQLASDQILVSLAAGVTFSQLAAFRGQEGTPLVRAIPNTAISEKQSMTIVGTSDLNEAQEATVMEMLNVLGTVISLPESKLAAATAAASCGIAYVLKYAQAASQAAIELGLKPEEAKTLLVQTLRGTAALLEKPGAHPSVEIDKVCTPGGLTIRGINALEKGGFTAAVIDAMKASV